MTSQQFPPPTRSTTTFSAGASLTIARNASVTLIIRHPRTIPIRRAETRAKVILSQLSQQNFLPSHSSLHIFITALFVILSILLPLLPIALHILHRNPLITVLAHLPAAFLSCLVIYLLTLFPHKPYLAVTQTHVIHRRRGLLSPIRSHPLSLIRTFSHHANIITADTISPNICIQAPDKHTASAAVQALNTALMARRRTPPPDLLLHTPGELIIAASTPLSQCELPPEKLQIETLGDRINIRTLPPPFPTFILIFLPFLVTHVASTVVLIFIFDDLPRTIAPTTPSMISAIALAAFYIASISVVLIWYFITCIPKTWKLIVVGYRKDVTTGMIDVGKCRQVVMVRDNKGFRVRLVSTTGSRFLDVGALSEGEAAKLITALRACFPPLFQESHESV